MLFSTTWQFLPRRVALASYTTHVVTLCADIVSKVIINIECVGTTVLCKIQFNKIPAIVQQITVLYLSFSLVFDVSENFTGLAHFSLVIIVSTLISLMAYEKSWQRSFYHVVSHITHVEVFVCGKSMTWSGQHCMCVNKCATKNDLQYSSFQVTITYFSHCCLAFFWSTAWLTVWYSSKIKTCDLVLHAVKLIKWPDWWYQHSAIIHRCIQNYGNSPQTFFPLPQHHLLMTLCLYTEVSRR